MVYAPKNGGKFAMNMLQDAHVLVVDDEPDIVEIIAFSFKHAGFHNVSMAGSGNQAIKVAQSQKVDIVVTDVRMPDGDGVHLAKSLCNETTGEAPVIVFITAFADISSEDARKLGATALLSKPFDLNRIVHLCSDAYSKKMRVDAAI
jgi:CheY-like chemotaxis protein